MFEQKPPDIIMSVAMVTYNHEKYILQALESIMMQKVNFKYEVVIGEDCSTDNTRQILLEYKKKYPSQIVLILQDENVGMNKNSYDVENACRGKYIASLEGDDYWTDENKLQKQVDFLERNSDYSGVYHNVSIIDKFCNVRDDLQKFYPYFEEHTVNFEEYIKKFGLLGQTASCVCRNFWKDFSNEEKENYYNCIANGDQKRSLELLFQGKVFYMCDVMSVYRRVIDSGDSWSARTHGKNMFKFHYFARKSLIEYAFHQKNMLISSNVMEELVSSAVLCFIKKPSKENFKIAKELINDYGNRIKIFKCLFKRCINKILYKQKRKDGINAN